MGREDYESGPLIGSSAGSSAASQSWAGRMLAKRRVRLLLVALVIAAIVAIAVGVAVKNSDDSNHGGAPRTGTAFGFQDMFNGNFSVARVTPTWSTDADNAAKFTYLAPRTGDIAQYDALTGATTTLLAADAFAAQGFAFGDYLLSGNGSAALLISNTTKVYRHTFNASYTLVDMTTQTLVRPFVLEDPDIQLAVWAPTGAGIAYVKSNNLYVVDAAAGATPTQITTSGTTDGTFVHGIPDWVYEEEVLASNSALWWSPGGSSIAFMSFNDTQVPFYTFPRYPLTPSNPYTELESFRYPKAGFNNPTVALSVFVRATQELLVLDLASGLIPDPATTDFLLTQITWISDTLLTVRQMPRIQQESVLLVCDISAANASVVPCATATHQQSTTGWLETYAGSLHFLPFSGQGAVTALDIVEINGFPTLAEYKLTFPLSDTPAVPTAVTDANWEIVSIDAIDTTSSSTSYRVFFTAVGRPEAAGAANPSQHHIYVYESSSGEISCISCTVDKTCTWNAASYDILASTILLSCNGPNAPYQTVRSTANLETRVFVVEENKPLKAALAALGDYAPQRRFFTIPVGAPDMFANVLYPPGFESDGSVKYPVLFDVYGGPFSQKVVSSFTMGYQAFLASSLGYIVVSVDGRGTGGRGVAYRNAVYRQLGHVETIDQIAAAQYFQTLPYVDKDRIAVWGWSYGGFMTSRIATAGSGTFKVAMAVAPVIEWEEYDSIYTERYMDTPQGNPAGYQGSSVLNSGLANISKLKYLVVHGTGDDNVHFQNTAGLVSALTAGYIDFQVQFYTNRDHSLNGGGTSQHLYRLLTNFLQRGLDRKELVV
ncbi:hypothetical protein CAOG_00473 [Capsaspora owczarzaki ATCC 30864]|uniref:Uncharacterized protein n=1 Tax=Capsaspora owczarzaki (strain ATCC 30864) TaxID=595528 RepID=A0A0D2WIK6_CAPO3|nr:hypothetical protein CAOG_00473 [Capsaspora owczarzaki ATCC 30864]KJE88898.1 hypothetical protein CAOG_000473 [Capsaspora owczarzaki ATCC 30864]|eukprot:XP_004365344.2 hypothetical protein CAOG_00473 [Capsaspora owczarzaki ATCC 30864]